MSSVIAQDPTVSMNLRRPAIEEEASVSLWHNHRLLKCDVVMTSRVAAIEEAKRYTLAYAAPRRLVGAGLVVAVTVTRHEPFRQGRRRIHEQRLVWLSCLDRLPEAKIETFSFRHRLVVKGDVDDAPLEERLECLTRSFDEAQLYRGMGLMEPQPCRSTYAVVRRDPRFAQTSLIEVCGEVRLARMRLPWGEPKATMPPLSIIPLGADLVWASQSSLAGEEGIEWGLARI
jgi:hypothetical protein